MTEDGVRPSGSQAPVIKLSGSVSLPPPTATIRIVPVLCSRAADSCVNSAKSDVRPSDQTKRDGKCLKRRMSTTCNLTDKLWEKQTKTARMSR